ncbi:hypothetical protein D3C86_1672980 [compost metagenome]
MPKVGGQSLDRRRAEMATGITELQAQAFAKVDRDRQRIVGLLMVLDGTKVQPVRGTALQDF